ncbi:MAG TPA: PEGA domain-containing protein [Polyangiales bacterium]|nr:PEGA domain-containing protein [Polyangiales bacterium]
MRNRTCLLAWLGLSCLAAFASPIAEIGVRVAHAQAAPDTADAARDHFRRGEAAYQKGSYDVAISEWEAAYAADPRPRIQYNLYQAYERLGQLANASQALQRYLSTADPEDPSYADATARMTALQQRLQATGIRLVGGVDGAAINVSGQDWGRLPRPDKISVQPGNHRVVVTMDGYREFVTNVVVPAGQVVDLAIQLEPIDGAAPGPAASDPSQLGAQPLTTPPPTQAEQGGNDTTAFFVVAGVLGAGAIGSGIWAINRVSELSGCNDSANFCPKEDTVKTQRTIAFVTTGVLAVGAIASLVYALAAGGEEDESSAALCRPDAAGGHCQLRF